MWLKLFFQIQFVVGRKNGAKGFVAIDDIEFKFIELCEFTPSEAKPITTTKTPPTTYPPECMYYQYNFFTKALGSLFMLVKNVIRCIILYFLIL